MLWPMPFGGAGGLAGLPCCRHTLNCSSRTLTSRAKLIGPKTRLEDLGPVELLSFERRLSKVVLMYCCRSNRNPESKP